MIKLVGMLGRVIFGLFFIVAGINHFVSPGFYLKMMPPYLPWHMVLVIASGVAEVVLGVGLLTRRFKRLAAWGVIALLIAVLPANLYMAMNPGLYPEIPEFALWIRLPIQGLLIFWAYIYTRTSVQDPH